jgi:hypothetical protein
MTRSTNSEKTEQKLRKITLEIKYEDGKQDAIIGIGDDRKIIYFHRTISNKEDAKEIYTTMIEIFGNPVIEELFYAQKDEYAGKSWEWWI